MVAEKSPDCKFFMVWPWVAMLSFVIGFGILLPLALLMNASISLFQFADDDVPELITKGTQPLDDYAEWVSKGNIRLLLCAGMGIIYSLAGIVVGSVQRRLLLTYIGRHWWWPAASGSIFLIFGTYSAITLFKLIAPGKTLNDILFPFYLESCYVSCLMFFLYFFVAPVLFVVFRRRAHYAF